MDVRMIRRLVDVGRRERARGLGRSEVADTWGPIAAVGWDGEVVGDARRTTGQGIEGVVERMGLSVGDSVTATAMGEAMGWSPVLAGQVCAGAGWRRWRRMRDGVRIWLWEVR